MSEKNFLDAEGLELILNYVKEQLGTKLNISDAIRDFARKQELNSYVNIDSMNAYASKEYVDNSITNAAYDDSALLARLEALESKVTNVYTFKGSVNNLEELSSITVRSIGDVYNIRTDGMNYAWTGEEWDNLGGLTQFPEPEEEQNP